MSAYGEGYSNAISSEPSFAIPTGTSPGFLTDVSLTVASDSDTADRLRLAWSAPEFDVNGFSVLPAGCAGGESPPSSPDAIEAYRVMWDTHPSFSNAQVYDVPAVSGDGFPQHCCPSESNDDGVCNIELGAEVQSISIKYPESSVSSSSGDDLFDTGAIRIAYVGPQSKSIQIITPMDGSREVIISPSVTLPISSPMQVGDLIRFESQSNVYTVSNVNNWPSSFDISSDYVASTSGSADTETVHAYFTTPPISCFDVSNTGNSAESFRSHLAQNFDNSPFDESLTVSRSTLIEPYESGESSDTRVIGYEYHVTFSGQGFSSTLGSPVEELLIMSDCGVPFVSNGMDISSGMLVDVSTNMDSGSLTPGVNIYVQVSAVNTNGVGPFVSAASETPKSQPGLAQNCQVSSVPTTSSSLKVAWDGVYPNHGQVPSSYRIEFYDVDAVSTDPVYYLVDDIDESSRYSIIKEDLIPGKRYKVLVVPVNDLGEGGPSWFSDFNPSGVFGDNAQFDTPHDFLERMCHAVPTCESGSVECNEVDAENFIIVARAVPPPPSIDVGTYPSVSNQNRFTKDSVLVTFESPLITDTNSNGIPTDKFLVEWSTSSSFLKSTEEGTDTLWSSEVTAQYSDDNGEDAVGELLIDSLTMGTQYYIRVSAHNTAGYGSSTNSIPATPMTRPDPPFGPILSSLTADSLASLHPGSSLTDSSNAGEFDTYDVSYILYLYTCCVNIMYSYHMHITLSFVFHHHIILYLSQRQGATSLALHFCVNGSLHE